MTGRRALQDNPLKVIRRSAKLTQQQLASLARVSQQTIVAVEWGVFLAPPPTVLSVLAEELLKNHKVELSDGVQAVFSPSMEKIISSELATMPSISSPDSPSLPSMAFGPNAQVSTTQPLPTASVGTLNPPISPNSSLQNMASDQAKRSELDAVALSLHVLWSRWVRSERQAHADELQPVNHPSSYASFVEYRKDIEERQYTYARLLVFDQRTLDLYEKNGWRRDKVFQALSEVLSPSDLRILEDLPHA